MDKIKLWVERVIESGGMLSMEDLNEGFRIKLMLDMFQQMESDLGFIKECATCSRLREKSGTRTILEPH